MRGENPQMHRRSPPATRVGAAVHKSVAKANAADNQSASFKSSPKQQLINRISYVRKIHRR
jgi:hypothetical protein